MDGRIWRSSYPFLQERKEKAPWNPIGSHATQDKTRGKSKRIIFISFQFIGLSKKNRCQGWLMRFIKLSSTARSHQAVEVPKTSFILADSQSFSGIQMPSPNLLPGLPLLYSEGRSGSCRRFGECIWIPPTENKPIRSLLICLDHHHHKKLGHLAFLLDPIYTQYIRQGASSREIRFRVYVVVNERWARKVMWHKSWKVLIDYSIGQFHAKRKYGHIFFHIGKVSAHIKIQC